MLATVLIALLIPDLLSSGVLLIVADFASLRFRVNRWTNDYITDGECHDVHAVLETFNATCDLLAVGLLPVAEPDFNTCRRLVRDAIQKQRVGIEIEQLRSLQVSKQAIHRHHGINVMKWTCRVLLIGSESIPQASCGSAFHLLHEETLGGVENKRLNQATISICKCWRR